VKTIQDYINAARFQLQDETSGAYRFTDAQFVMALSSAFDEAYRVRPDFFVRQSEPDLIGKPLTTEVPAPRGYQMAFVYYMMGWVTMSNQEDTEDARAGTFLNKFVAQLQTTAS